MIVKKRAKVNITSGFFAENAPPEVYEKLAQLQDMVELEQRYNGAIREISTKLEVLDDEFHVRYDHNPIHHIETRLKSPQSIAEKLIRKNLEVSTSSAVQNLTDIAGIRVICYYPEDVYKIAELLLRQDDIRLIRRSDYIADPKPNGYRSLHLVVEVPVFLAEETIRLPVEIQVRTIVMDFWASLEHQIRYKSDKAVPERLRRELKECAEESARLDARMQNIYKEMEQIT